MPQHLETIGFYRKLLKNIDNMFKLYVDITYELYDILAIVGKCG